MLKTILKVYAYNFPFFPQLIIKYIFYNMEIIYFLLRINLMKFSKNI